MLEKLKSLSMGVKAGIASGVVLLAAAGVGLGILQGQGGTDEGQGHEGCQEQRKKTIFFHRNLPLSMV